MAQVSKISSFKSFTEVKNQEATMKLREENNAKRQETVGKIGAILDEMGLTSLSELDEVKKQALINKMFGSVSEDEAEDIEDEINKLGEPKKLDEGNAFIFAASKAKQEGKEEFEFNGKKYKVTLKKDTGLKEGNAFGDAVRKAKEDGEKEFEFEGETYKVEESLNEGKHGMAKKLLKGIVDGNSSQAEGIKLSKDLADHYLYWINTSPYGKKNENLPLNMLIKASFNWGIERQLDPKLKKELEDLKTSQAKNESVESIDEARSISKIQYDWSKVTTQMQATAQNWKAAEGAAKESLLGKLKEMTAQKKALEAELDAAIADKDKDLELVVTEAFFRLPKDVVGTELYTANQNIQSLYSRLSAGNDVDPKDIDSIIKLLQQVKSLTKKFNNKEEVLGTVYEGEVNEAENFKSTKDFLDFLEEIDGMPENRIKRIMGKDYIDTPGGFRDEADDYDNDIEEYTRSNMGNKDFEKLKTWWETNVAESLVTEAEVKSDDEFKEYAMTVLKKAFGDEFDEAKAGEVVDGILKKCGDDYGAAVGMLTSSLGESVVTEGFDVGDNVSILSKSTKKPFDSGVVVRIQKDGGIVVNNTKTFSSEIVLDAKDLVKESVVTEGFDANYWEDYHDSGESGKIKNPSGMQVQQEVSGCVEDWNDNNEDGPDNEVSSAGEKKVLKLAKEFVKAKGWISSDVIDAMIAQES